MERQDALESLIISTVSIPEYFNRFLADSAKGIDKLLDTAGASVLCPFHDDVVPSFRYWKQKNFFRCFGCDKSGDVINLHRLTLQRKLNMGVRRSVAITDLCKVYNIALGIPDEDGVVVAQESVFDKARRLSSISDGLAEHRKHFSMNTFKQANENIKSNPNLSFEEKFKAYEKLDLKTTVAINATADRFEVATGLVID